MQTMPRYVFFDMDGTLAQGNSWFEAHRALGTMHVSSRNLRMYKAGKIDYAEFMRRDVAAWSGEVHEVELEAVMRRYRLQPGTEAALTSLRRLGVPTAIISAGIDHRAELIMERLGMDHRVANIVTYDELQLVKGAIPNVDPFNKHLAFREMCEALGVDPAECMAVGDSIYDKTFLEMAGQPVAFRPTPELKEQGFPEITDHRQLLQYLNGR